MCSIIMHIYISQRIQKELNLSNKFLAGAILPDMIKHKTKDWHTTHYGNNGLPDLNKFLDLNKYKLNDEITIGYYAHLIEDKIWFEKYTDKFIKYMDDGNLLYVKDNTIHDLTDLYLEYDRIDNYIIEQKKMDIDNVRDEIKKQLNGYDLDREIEKYVTLPNNVVNNDVKLISNYWLNSYINESVSTVKESVIEILGE